jgi:class 3 adenylate cyclase/tetratricopeptide (TPR) repeat protein
MKCPKCQFENSAGAKFCIECGYHIILSRQTPPAGLSYDEQLEKIQRYLPTGLTEKILTQKDKIEGERRQVTVLFCDMEGFAMMVRKLGSEQSYTLMDQIYEILIHKVHEFEGTVNEMTGDGIMALFGAPIALEDAPQRALSSALAIHREMAEFSALHPKIGPIRMRIGIHTGPVVVGTLGNDLRVEFKAVGDTVNLASRMEQLAEAGSTYVTEDTFRLTQGLFHFEHKGKRPVIGKENTIPVYKVLSSKEDVYRPRLGSERRIYSKLVGRNQELNRLELQVMKAINGVGSVINIIGEAGIGKSRLVAELKKREAIKRVALFEGRAISIGKNLSFHPIIDLLKQWAQIKEDDGEAMALGKLESAVRSICSEKTGEVLPFVATLMGMKLSGRYAARVKGIEGEALEKLILKSLRELLIRATEITPLIIVVEDLQWADMSSIELMESLFRLAETNRILFINVFRPGYRETGDRIAETVKEKLPVYSLEIVLEPLNEKMSEALITNMLNISGPRHAVIEKVTQRAGGNPFFIEEVVRSLIDEGAIILKNGTFQVTEKIDRVVIPNSISGVLMARVDRLDEETRNLVKVASVIGRTFFFKVLSEAADPIEDIDSRLSYLKEIQLFRERSRMDEVEYLFKHALTQETAYESILPRKRMEMHLKVAASIEKVFNERLYEFFGMLAYHYSRAENLEKAEEYLIKSGEEALKSSASNEALHYYQEALHIYLEKYGDSADPEKIALLQKNIAIALYNKGQYVAAIDYFDMTLDHYTGKLPKRDVFKIFKLFSACVHLLIALYLPLLKFKKIPTQEDIEIIDLFLKKIRALSMIDPKRFFFEYLYIQKRITDFDLTEFVLGYQTFAGASALFSFTGISFRLSGQILNSVKQRVLQGDAKISIIYDLLETIHHLLKGNWKAIKDYDKDLINKSLQRGEIYDAALNLYWHSFLYIYNGSFNDAKSIADSLKEIFEVYNHDLSKSLKYEAHIHLLMEYRQLNEALIEVEEGIAFVEKASLSYFLLDLYSCQTSIYILKGNIEEAEKSFKRAKKVMSEVDSPVPFQLANFYRSQLEYDLYRLTESLSYKNKAVASDYRKQAFKSCKIMRRLGQRVALHRTAAHKLNGIYFWLINKQEKALKCWQRAMEEAERLGARLELSRVYFEIGKRLLEAKSKYKKFRGIGAEDYLEKAGALFEEMDLQWDLDELSRVSRS